MAPPPGFATSVRTAVAEDAPAGGDSSGPEADQPAPDPGVAPQAPLPGPLALVLGAQPVQLSTSAAVAVKSEPHPAPPRPLPVGGPPAPAETPATVSAPAPVTPGSSTAAPAPPTTPGAVSDVDVQAPASPAVPGPRPEPVPMPLVRPAHGPQVDADPATQAAAPATQAAAAATQAAAPAQPERNHHAPQPVTGDGRPAQGTGTATAPVQLTHGGQTAGDPSQQQRDASGDRQPAHTTTTAPVPAASTPTAPAPSAGTGTPLVQTAAAPPLQPGQTVDAPATPGRPVHLRELPEAFQAAVRVAVQDGSTTARIALRPEHLGHVEIRLHYQADGGITAQVTAESRGAAAALTAQAPDLRRALEAQGLNVLGLDIQQSGVGAGSTPDRQAGFDRATLARVLADEGAEETTTIDLTSLPLAGGQVNVLA